MVAAVLGSRSRGARWGGGAALVAASTAVVILASGGGSSHTLRAAFESAVQVVPGQQVRIAGRPVGAVRSVALSGGRAVVVLNIDDADWPLRRGTVARLRLGQPVTYASRYVELIPPPHTRAGQPLLPDGGILTTADTVTPVEFDQLYRTFGPRTRRNFQGLLSNASATLRGHGHDLARGVARGAGGMQSFAGLYEDLGADRVALRTLVVAGARTTAALRRRETALRGLVGNAAATFDELADHARAVQRSLQLLPANLEAGRRTLARLDGSLAGLQGLVDDVRPGAAGLRRIAPTVRRAVSTLQDVAPRATATLRTGERAAPAIRRLLATGTPFMPRLASVFRRLAPMAGCLRPYGPEIAGALSVYGVGYRTNYDRAGHYDRAAVQSSFIPVGNSMTTKQAVDQLGGDRLTYAMPRPPGLNVGQPWFIPECGVTRDALDPGKDPETER